MSKFPADAPRMGADDFKITVPLNQALFGFGDAVCVPVIEWIARNYLNPIWEEHSASATAEAARYVALQRTARSSSIT